MSIGKRRALVTGGAAGLGQAMVLKLRDEGWEVFNIDRDGEALRRMAETSDGAVIGIEADLARREEYPDLLRRLVARGPYDLAVMNAGINCTGAFEEIPLGSHRDVLSVNLYAVLEITRGLIAADTLSEGGQLVFVSSLSHITGYPGAASYAATKDAVAIYARSLSKPLRQKGVSVTCAFPGPLRTAHAEANAPSTSDPSRRMPPERAADLILTAAKRRKQVVYPGGAAKLVRVAGTLFPRATTGWIRRNLFEPLVADRNDP